MLKSCSKCGRIHPYNYECKAVKRVYQSTQESKVRSTYAWTKKSLEIRDKAQGLCEVCRDKGIYTYKGLEVHHIVKIKDDISKAFDDSNLICLCTPHHKEADEGKISIEYLTTLVNRREEIPPST